MWGKRMDPSSKHSGQPGGHKNGAKMSATSSDLNVMNIEVACIMMLTCHTAAKELQNTWHCV